MKSNRRCAVYVASFFMALAVICLTCYPSFSEEEGESVLDQVDWVHGPETAELEDWAEIHVPVGYVFANGDDTRLLMEAMGNPSTDIEVGFFAPDTLDWFVVFEFEEVGYVNDDEKDDLDTDAMLDSIKEGTERGNKIRKKQGYPELHIIGWEVEPQYNEETNNLEWAIRGQDDEDNLVINHNTRLLGRKGVMRATLVVDPESFEDVLPAYRANLDAFAFTTGNKYAEYVKGDKIAKYGLTALVAGGAGAAAAKLGLFKILAKYFKAIIIAVIAFFSALWKKIKNIFFK